ncbi:hypothetical protein MBLNU459_g3457t1 [Dothideomycetes sp. NU459]
MEPHLLSHIDFLLPEVPSSESGWVAGEDRVSSPDTSDSAVYEYRYENGRRYHAYMDGKYPVPNDEIESERLDLQHYMFLLTIDGKTNLAPLPDNLINVLDVGCGTGKWAIEFAEAHPEAKVQGVDLSPIQPVGVPPNCSFMIDNAEADWVYEDKFDYIHSRAMIAGFRDWPRFFKQAFANLQPGGYLELQDFCFPAQTTENHTPETSRYLEWTALMMEATTKAGLDFQAPQKFGKQLQQAGFVDIHIESFAWPIGPWAKGKKQKILGQMALANGKEAIAAGALALFTRVLGWTRESVEEFLTEVQKELMDQQIHLYTPVVFCYARKPIGGGQHVDAIPA